MDKIIVENYRCFNKRYEIELRPLTILIGENSTGKTSLLAAIRLATSFDLPSMRLDFNSEPFVLGAFNQIASYASGRTGRAKHFTIGYEKSITKKNERTKIRTTVKFTSEKGLPVISEYSADDLVAEVGGKAEVIPDAHKVVFTFRSKDIDQSKKEYDLKEPFWLYSFMEAFSSFLKEIRPELKFAPYYNFLYPQERSYAFAPVRTRPERTYDPRSAIPQPEGNHVPSVLNQLEDDPEAKHELDKEIEQYGTSSGLFKKIGVRRLGRESDPFQIQVKIAGPPKNLIDVGYGVSQVLPIIFDTLFRRENIFLMQQPEIHLHPRAQAALGTYLGHIAKVQGKQFIVETHSDYLIDRIRLDIRDEKTGLGPDDVLILYLQRRGNTPWVKVFPITIDKNGNIKGAPKGYRDFFLKEQARLFNI